MYYTRGLVYAYFVTLFILNVQRLNPIGFFFILNLRIINQIGIFLLTIIILLVKCRLTDAARISQSLFYRTRICPTRFVDDQYYDDPYGFVLNFIIFSRASDNR